VTATVKDLPAAKTVNRPTTAERIAAIKATVMELRAPFLIAVGLVLSAAWTASLPWLLMKLLALF
jgi:hypothetical protein